MFHSLLRHAHQHHPQYPKNVIEIRASVEIKSHKHNTLHAYFCDLFSNIVHRRLFLLFSLGI
jgi:hypothetical protein